MLGLPHSALVLELGVAVLGLLLEALLALCGLAFVVTGCGELGFEGPAALPQTGEASQLPELIGELLTLGGGISGLGGRVLGVGERVLEVGVLRQGGYHPRRLVALHPRPVKLDPGLVALLAGSLQLSGGLVAPFAL